MIVPLHMKPAMLDRMSVAYKYVQSYYTTFLKHKQ